MSKMACINCGELMWDGSDRNTFEHYLIQSNTPQLQRKEYDKIIADVNEEQLEWRKNSLPEEDYAHIDTWYDICSKLGNTAWICPNCQTMHIFNKDWSKGVERLYKLVDEVEWRESSEKDNWTHPTCPQCGSDNIAAILYGEPAFDERLEKALADGKIVLGGCVVDSLSPKRHCNDCKHDFAPKNNQ